MRKRIFSILLCVCMALSLLPVSALAATAEDGEASVTASDNTVTYYDTIEEAITAAQSLSGSTLTLLADATTESEVTINSGTFTIDLNGKTWTYNNSTTYWALDQLSSGEITIKNGAITGGAVVEEAGTLIIDNVKLSNDKEEALILRNKNNSKLIFNSGSVTTNAEFSVEAAKPYPTNDCIMQINWVHVKISDSMIRYSQEKRSLSKCPVHERNTTKNSRSVQCA